MTHQLVIFIENTFLLHIRVDVAY